MLSPEPPRGTVRSYLATYGNPVYHVRKMREDLAAAAHALKIWRLSRLEDDPAAFANAVRGKLFATFVVAGAVSTLALPLGAFAQAATNSAWAGLFWTIGIGHVLANGAFQVIWYGANRDLYAEVVGSRHRFMALQHDLMPIQWGGLKIAGVLTAIALPLNALGVVALETFAPHLIRVLPIGLLALVFDALLFNSQFVRAMGNLFERHSRRLTARYAHRCGRLTA